MHAVAKGIVAHSNPSQLQEHGGHLQIGVKWAQSFLTCRGYVKRKATKAARKLPPNFEDFKAAFLHRICSEIVFLQNWSSIWTRRGQSRFLLASGHWLNKEARKCQSLARMTREITVILAVSAATTRANLSWEDVMLFHRDGTSNIVIITGVQRKQCSKI